MNFKNSTDQSLLAMWNSIQRQVAADEANGGRYRFVGPTVRAHAEELQSELEARNLRYTPIRWH